MNKARLIPVIMFGIVGSSLLVYNAMSPKKKTVDDYVKCFNREVEMYKLPDNAKEIAKNPVWYFRVVFDLKRISGKEAEEFMQKSGYIFEREIIGGSWESVSYKVEVPTYEKAEKLSGGLFKCLQDSIKSTYFGYSNTKME